MATEMKTIKEITADLEGTRRFFEDVSTEEPDWDWCHESLMSCDILLLILRQEKIDPNMCAYFAYVVLTKFKGSKPTLLLDAARNILQWAKSQEGIVKYGRSHGLTPIEWKTEAP